MNKFKLLIAAALSSTVFAANAAVITVSDTFDPADVTIVAPNTYTYTHIITDNGYNPLTDSLTGATITVTLSDTTNTGQNNETFKFVVGENGDAQLFDGYQNVPNGGSTNYPLTLAASLNDLRPDGSIQVVLTVKTGDLIFQSSTLSATVDQGARTRVPEPASLGLMGLGLVGLGMRRRKQ